jgi:hypothetical protein
MEKFSNKKATLSNLKNVLLKEIFEFHGEEGIPVKIFYEYKFYEYFAFSINNEIPENAKIFGFVRGVPFPIYSMFTGSVNGISWEYPGEENVVAPNKNMAFGYVYGFIIPKPIFKNSRLDKFWVKYQMPDSDCRGFNNLMPESKMGADMSKKGKHWWFEYLLPIVDDEVIGDGDKIFDGRKRYVEATRLFKRFEEED